MSATDGGDSDDDCDILSLAPPVSCDGDNGSVLSSSTALVSSDDSMVNDVDHDDSSFTPVVRRRRVAVGRRKAVMAMPCHDTDVSTTASDEVSSQSDSSDSVVDMPASKSARGLLPKRSILKGGYAAGAIDNSGNRCMVTWMHDDSLTSIAEFVHEDPLGPIPFVRRARADGKSAEQRAFFAECLITRQTGMG